MWGWLGGLVSFVLGLLGFKRNVTPAPSQEAVQAKQAGADETALAVETKSDATVTAARQASDASVAASVKQPDSVRLPDPDSRD
jgi:hypothetical protein